METSLDLAKRAFRELNIPLAAAYVCHFVYRLDRLPQRIESKFSYHFLTVSHTVLLDEDDTTSRVFLYSTSSEYYVVFMNSIYGAYSFL
jgi:hypothetical protein